MNFKRKQANKANLSVRRARFLVTHLLDASERRNSESQFGSFNFTEVERNVGNRGFAREAGMSDDQGRGNEKRGEIKVYHLI